MSQTNVVELNVGGKHFTTKLSTLTSFKDSKLFRLFNDFPRNIELRDSNNLPFIDRNGEVFTTILDYLRDPKSFHIPGTPDALDRLRTEAEFYNLPELVAQLQEVRRSSPCTITLSYRAQTPNGRDSLADVRFRKITRILVSGKSSVCREVFGETLNESRAPDCGPEDKRYSSRYYLTHNTLEMAFDKLLEAGFTMAGCCGETAGVTASPRPKAMGDYDDSLSQYFHEFYFVRMK